MTSLSIEGRPVVRILEAPPEHWVGDGFRVRSVIAPGGDPSLQSPFLLLDHAPRRHFAPAAQPRGVGAHPHRGFETVTFAYHGEIEHRDSTGAGGVIGKGDVQWMTAAGGLVHDEFHSRAFTAQGGELEMVQLWVNLPAKHKLDPPRYQALLDAQFPRLDLGPAQARLIAGSLMGRQGPAQTYTPITLFDLTFAATQPCHFELPLGHTAMALTLEGEVRVGPQAQHVIAGHMAVFEPQHAGAIVLDGAAGARVLVLAGEPIREPVAAYGPFVMNTRAELMQAIQDFQDGKMGQL